MQSNYFPNPYFKEEELKCKGSGVLKLAPGFLGELVWLRKLFCLPMVVTSCCRSPAHNSEVGGSPTSFHLTENEVHQTGGTLAIDILTKDGEYRQILIEVASDLGWSIGLGKGFLHLDKRIHIGLPRVDFHY